MSSESFVHLHCHTDMSMLDGAANITKLVKEAARQQMPALAITDHGYLFGAYEFYAACKAEGIKPIIGLEAYVTPGTSRFDRTRVRWGEESQKSDDVSASGAYTHITLLSYTTEGMHNLFRLGSLASLEGQWGKWPRVDRELLETYHHGLIGTSGCPSGEVQTRLRLGQTEQAYRAAGELQDIFGKDNFYIEFMDHGIDIERRVKGELLELAKKIGAPAIATNDSHYVHKEDAEIQDAILCINSGSHLSEPDRFKFDGEGYYLRSSDEMRKIFGDIPGACDNTLIIAERCEVKFQTVADGISYMPEFAVPAGESIESWFVKEVQRGLHYRYGQTIPAHIQKQADYEVEIILQMGFPGYFLVVADYIQWAKNHGIRVGPGRGSGAGSMVAYCMRITDLDPLEHGLVFERFLNPERVSMPDFDIDFDDRRRGEVIDYVTEKYGADRVAQVVTFGKIKAKQALKDSVRILGMPYGVGEKLTKAMPPSVMGKDIPISGIYDPKHKRYAEAQEFRKLVEEEQELQPAVDLARGLEGITRQWGVHACAVIMSSRPLVEIIPMMRRPADGAVITQFEYPVCETLGLLKMDFLGLKNLTVIEDTIHNIEMNGKTAPVLDQLALDDKKTYEIMARGDTIGVFQLDSSGMRTLLRQMKPDNFEDISALGALYRPGPMGAGSHTNYALRKNGLQAITPIHPEIAEPLDEILSPTYGLIVYQEQVMSIARKVANYTLGQADILRRAMGKKKKAELEKQFEKFSEGMLSNGYSKEAIDTLWNILEPFSDYAFNKSHSAAYGLVSYWTAYLKTHYSVEFMAALLTAAKDNKDKVALYLSESRRMKITVLPPDVNESGINYTAVGSDIRVGISAVRNVGLNVVEAIIKAREEYGKFTSFHDFLDKCPLSVCNKRTVESLIKAGSFDFTGHSRRALLAIHEETINQISGAKRKEAEGMVDLFGEFDSDSTAEFFDNTVPELEEWDKKQKLEFERIMLGLYVSDHPLSGLERVLEQNSDTQVANLFDEETNHNNRPVTLAGIVSSVITKTTRKGNLYAVATIEDITGSVEVMIWPNVYEQVANVLQQDAVVSLRGFVEDNSGQIKVTVREINVLDVSDINTQPVGISLTEVQCNPILLKQLQQVIRTYPGMQPVNLRIVFANNQYKTLAIDSKFSVNASSSFYSELKVLLGAGCLYE